MNKVKINNNTYITQIVKLNQESYKARQANNQHNTLSNLSSFELLYLVEQAAKSETQHKRLFGKEINNV